jgi:basic amino acid/polyamine antiporter, APA family
MRGVFGPAGIPFISILIIISALGAMNGSILTGSRTNYTLGEDFPFFSFLGKWDARSNTPRRALLFQGAVSLVLTALGTLAHNGFVVMVEYTAPVFWCFFLLTGLSLFVLRKKDPDAARPFRVPLYPLTPLLFCGMCLYMLQSSLAYTGNGALVGVAVLSAGALVLFMTRGGVRLGWSR